MDIVAEAAQSACVIGPVFLNFYPQFEMHFSLARTAKLMSAMKRTEELELDASGLTSAALTIHGANQPRIQVDLFVPYSELKVMSKINRR